MSDWKVNPGRISAWRNKRSTDSFSRRERDRYERIERHAATIESPRKFSLPNTRETGVAKMKTRVKLTREIIERKAAGRYLREFYRVRVETLLIRG